MASELSNQVDYWDSVATKKTFHSPFDFSVLEGFKPSLPILDYGCGQGRILRQLSDRGFLNLHGVDSSHKMITLAETSLSNINLIELDSPPTTPFPDEYFAFVVLFSVLTCIPRKESQRQLISEMKRVLAPGGQIYISDFEIQSDQRNLKRYAKGGPIGELGVFETEDGAVLRHHTQDYLRELLSDFALQAVWTFPGKTMNGNPTVIIQLLAQRKRR
jgi:ubiquinone/menaquinone biosynthesis C-methylase UbiE